MLNKVFLQGRLVADPELRHTQSGVAVATFRLAVDRDFKSRDNADGGNNADFINIVAWRNTAEFVSRYFTKGRMALVDGRLQIRTYNDRDNNRRTIAEVVADNIYFGDSRRDGAAPAAGAPYSAPQANNYGGNFGAPAATGSYAPPAYAPAGPSYAAPVGNEFAELSDDDGELPF